MEIDYKPFDEESVTLLFHPHYLKEYNGRWHLFGHAGGREPKLAITLQLTEYKLGHAKEVKLSISQHRNIFMMSFFKTLLV